MNGSPWHCNYKVNRIIAKEIFGFLEPKLSEESGDEYIKLSKNRLIDAYMEKYFSDYRAEGRIGAIVMNCNPFTKGHRYLIEEALKMVDKLIIFVVEEDKSLFTFKERYAMVREGTKDLKNITVVPSGNFILSQTTFPEYFLKIEDKDLAHHVEYDITLFAEYIAPKLNITFRFVGEEKSDKVTDEYNLAMKRILPQYGIKIVEIPRKKLEDGSDMEISASYVRKRLEHGIPEDISEVLEESTIKLLAPSW
jgi:[citrate (pro-3S)-lyase] ligase